MFWANLTGLHASLKNNIDSHGSTALLWWSFFVDFDISEKKLFVIALDNEGVTNSQSTKLWQWAGKHEHQLKKKIYLPLFIDAKCPTLLYSCAKLWKKIFERVNEWDIQLSERMWVNWGKWVIMGRVANGLWKLWDKILFWKSVSVIPLIVSTWLRKDIIKLWYSMPPPTKIY